MLNGVITVHWHACISEFADVLSAIFGKGIGVRITSALLRKRVVWYNKGFNDNFPVYFCILFVLH